jgi:hypothetical protein
MSTASPASNRDPVTFEDFAADIARRREAAGNPDMPRNAGNRRTPAKRALLKAIAETGKRG